jgi:hypothetical protein
MKTKLLLTLTALLALANVARAQGTAFTYQGRLDSSGAPANGIYDLRFSTYDADSGGNLRGLLTNNAVAVSNGLFTTTLDFGFGVFNGGPRWLEIGVRSNGTAAAFNTLAPRQAVLPAPYAFWSANASQAVTISGTVPASGLNGLYSNPVNFSNPGNSIIGGFAGDGTGLNNVNAAQLGGRSAAQFWQTSGNDGANPTNGAFLGTTDNLPFEIRVGGERALRLEPHAVSPNVILGHPANSVSNAAAGVFVTGGNIAYPNRAGGFYASALGGVGNSAGGLASVAMGIYVSASGYASLASGQEAIASGNYSKAMGFMSVASGSDSSSLGVETVASGGAATALGYQTTASGYASTALGSGSRATNNDATAMGRLTLAGGSSSTAMGYRARALHAGSLVWADQQEANFDSTAGNQFAVRASGGLYLQGKLGIGNPSPAFPLDVRSGQAVGVFTSTNSTFGSVLVLQNNTASPAYLGAINFQDAISTTQGQIAYRTNSGGELNFRVSQVDRMALTASGLTVNPAGGPQAYLGGDGVGGDVQLGSATAGNEAVALWNSASGQYMDLFARSGTFRGNLGFGTTTRQMLNLYGTGYGIGVQTDATYFRTSGEFMWFRGGSHTNAFGDPGAGGTQLMRLGNTGNLVIAGTLSQGSDRNIKQDFAALDGREVLEKVAALPIQSWSYTSQPGVKHYGPTAQDFHVAFGLNGADDKHIATVDADGVALAAIQGLNRKVEAGNQHSEARSQRSESKIEALEAENAELKARLEKLEQLLHAMNGGAR